MAELPGYAIGGRITESVVGDGSVIASDIVVTYRLTQTRVEDPAEDNLGRLRPTGTADHTLGALIPA